MRFSCPAILSSFTNGIRNSASIIRSTRQGVMSHSINWDLLEDQYLSDGIYREKLSKMVTIVDEAFLAGKKFARTYSETIEADPKAQSITAPLEKTIDTTLDCAVPLKQTTDSRSTEDALKNNGIVDVYSNMIDTQKSKPDTNAIEQLKTLEEDLRNLLAEKLISQELFEKLTSNDKFELDAEDIECLNKLSANERFKDILLRCKVAEIRNNGHLQKKTEQAQQTNSQTQPDSISLTQPDSSPVRLLSKSMSEPVTIAATITPKLRTRKSWHVSDLTSDFWLNLPFMRSSGKKIDITKIHWRDREALQFMRGIMDECTHLSNFSIPYDTSLIIAVCAKHDAYVPRDDVGTLEEIWPGAEVRYVDAGHVSAYILHQSLFRSCIKEAFERSKKKWVDGKHIN